MDDKNGKANVVLESNIKIQPDEWGDNFEKATNGYIDFLLLDERGFPWAVLEAKSEDKNPLVGKEQARKYAKSQNCRFVILSNGNHHYFWDLQSGNPQQITQFPRPGTSEGFKNFAPDRARLVNEHLEADYIARAQMPDYDRDPQFLNPATRPQFLEKTGLRFLRDYQIRALKAIQRAVGEKKDRFLFEMATGTGKTLTSAAVIKLFLRTGNARRALFLVDRLELEDQAQKDLSKYLAPDYKSIIYKENRDDWRKAEIVVTTVQSLLFNDKFKRVFSPTDFDLVISDEAHRSIGGNARAVFEYFIGYKLGLTATPRDYLKKFDPNKKGKDPRELEKRILLDTYRTFGSDSGEPTFRYSLTDGVRDGFLINPKVVDARTDVTTQLLSDNGYAAFETNEDGETGESTFFQRDFEKKFFSENTNRLFCQTFLKNALRDPVSGEIGKSIVFAVSQNHAAKLTQMLNELADQLFPGRYNSDFAMQVTSLVDSAQQMTINFRNNNLGGSANFNAFYRTSKTRVCVTVGMMTTGYDCPDILNLCLMRPIFSPTDFIQIKGRGTRKHSFSKEIMDERLKEDFRETEKTAFKLFDFFANCEYFEEEFNYDEVLRLPPVRQPKNGEPGGATVDQPPGLSGYETFEEDKILTFNEAQIGLEGMKVDRMFFQNFEETVRRNSIIEQHVRAGQWDWVIDFVNRELMHKPTEFFTLEKLRRAAAVDRRIGMREILEKIFGLIPKFKMKDELLEDEFEKFILDHRPGADDDVVALKYFFKAYLTDHRLRDILENRRFAELNVNPTFNINDFKAIKKEWRSIVPEYIKDYVPLNKFM